MNIVSEIANKKIIRKSPFKKKILKKGIYITLIVSGLLIGIILGKTISFDSKTTKIGFEDIGELATQTSHCTEVSVTDESRNLFGIKIPFTQSKYIYSYDIHIKAGFNFKDIEWNVNGKTIEVKLPKVKILSSEVDLDSFKIYHEEESIFKQITLTDNNKAMSELKKKAEEDSINNGLLENARDNAEVILKGFFANSYDMKEYELVFEDK